MKLELSQEKTLLLERTAFFTSSAYTYHLCEMQQQHLVLLNRKVKKIKTFQRFWLGKMLMSARF